MASDKLKLRIHTSQPELMQPQAARRIIKPKRLSIHDRLLRNSALACALLLGILALGNVQQPWAKKASATVEKALTMEIDLDKSLGQLKFVRKLMPESTLVFFNLGAESELLKPVQGELKHSFTQTQPWLLFTAKEGSTVCAVADGTVTAVSPMSGGGYGMLIDHGNGLESVTACLSNVDAAVGASVLRGGIIGKTDGELYFELREAGTSADPTGRMGL